jgi:RNA polymerase sigma-70 factor (ECF subfamily)
MAESPFNGNDPDRLLVERATGGDAHAFEQLLLRYEQRVFYTILRITKIREDAEDQTQETFIRAYRNLKHFRGSSLFKTWLTQIAINQALMCLRKRQAGTVSFSYPSADDCEDSSLQDLAGPGLNPEQQWARTKLANQLEDEVNRLPKTLRSAFVLRCVHEYTSIEASIRLGVSIAAVKSRVSRARKRLRERIEGGSVSEVSDLRINSDHSARGPFLPS